MDLDTGLYETAADLVNIYLVKHLKFLFIYFFFVKIMELNYHTKLYATGLTLRHNHSVTFSSLALLIVQPTQNCSGDIKVQAIQQLLAWLSNPPSLSCHRLTPSF